MHLDSSVILINSRFLSIYLILMKLHIVINRRPIIILKTLVNICLHVIMHAHMLVVVHIRWIERVHLWLLMVHWISHLVMVCLLHSHVNLTIWRHCLLRQIWNNTLWRVKVIVHHLVLSLKVLIWLLHHLMSHVHLLMLSSLTIRITLILLYHVLLGLFLVILHVKYNIKFYIFILK